MTCRYLQRERRRWTLLAIFTGCVGVALLFGFAAGRSSEKMRVGPLLDEKLAYIERLDKEIDDLKCLAGEGG